MGVNKAPTWGSGGGELVPIFCWYGKGGDGIEKWGGGKCDGEYDVKWGLWSGELRAMSEEWGVRSVVLNGEFGVRSEE